MVGIDAATSFLSIPEVTMERTEIRHDGHAGELVGTRWLPDESGEVAYVAILVHGYGEHVGRYDWVAEQLTNDGAAVYAHDHLGHGRSAGERVLISDFEPVVEDVHRLELIARQEHPGVPVVVVGHSMGGLIGARYGQRYGKGLACLVLSGPVIGRLGWVEELRALDPIPEVPIDPATLSRDPAVGEAYAADPLVWHGPFQRATLDAMAAGMARITADGSVALPVLWLHGEDDQLVPIDGSREGWATLRGSLGEDKSYPQARHEIFNETNKDEVLADVRSFIRRHV